MILYGISTCDTCRKARKELEATGHEVIFRDLRTDPLSAEEVSRFLAIFGEDLVNRRSTTWRALSEVERAEASAALLARYPVLMKRPLLAEGEKATLGWDAATRSAWGA